MINRAKCKLCLSVIESHLPDEIVSCKCGAISVCDGPAMRMLPLGSPNFIRVDDLGNEIIVKYISEKDAKGNQDAPKDEQCELSVEDAIHALQRSIEYNESLPDHEKCSFVTCDEITTYLKSILNILRNLRKQKEI